MRQAVWFALFSAVCVFSSQVSAKKYIPVVFGNELTIIIPVDEAPVAQADSFSVTEDSSQTLDILSNDTDENPQTLTIGIVASTTNGTLQLGANGQSLTYTPNPDFFGQDSFTYQLTDEKQHQSEVVTANISVNNVNDAPVAMDVTQSVVEDTAITIAPLANDADDNELAFIVATPPANGSIEMVNKQFLYTPGLNFYGTDSFTYTAFDGHAHSIAAHVTVTVTPVNDAPKAQADTYTLIEDSGSVLLTVLENDTDAENQSLTVELLRINDSNQFSERTLSLNNNGTFSYQPPVDVHGQDWFEYRVQDSAGSISEIVRATIIVTPQNDAPVAYNMTAELDEDSNTTLSPTATDTDQDNLTFSVSTQPSNGTVTVNNNQFVYTPNANFHGTDSFQWIANDGNANSNTAQVTFTVIPVNDAPQLLGSALLIQAREDVPEIINIMEAVTDADGDPLSIQSLQVDKGRVEQYNRTEFVYYSPPHYNSPAHNNEGITVTVRVTDGQESVDVQWQISVSPELDVPKLSYHWSLPGGEGNVNFYADVVNEDKIAYWQPYLYIFDANGQNAIQGSNYFPDVYSPIGPRDQIRRWRYELQSLQPGTYQVVVELKDINYVYQTDYRTEPKVMTIGNGPVPENLPPIAMDDGADVIPFVYSGIENSIDVLANDSDDNGQISIDDVNVDTVKDTKGNTVGGRMGEVQFTISQDRQRLSVATDICFSGDVHATYTISDEDGATDTASIDFSSFVYDLNTAPIPADLTSSTDRFNWQAGANNSVTLSWSPVFHDGSSNVNDYHYKVMLNNDVVAPSIIANNYNSVTGKFSYNLSLSEPGEYYAYVAACLPGSLLCGCYSEQAAITAWSLDVENFHALNDALMPGNDAVLAWDSGTFEQQDFQLQVKRPGSSSWDALAVQNGDLQLTDADLDAVGEHQYQIKTCVLDTDNSTQCGDWSSSVSVFVADNAVAVESAPAVILSDYSNHYSGEVASAKVGMSGGQFRVDESGAATWQLPLSLPAGIAGVAPQLGLSYSSAGGNGPLGMGWSVNGLSQISRCRATLEQDGFAGDTRFDAQDRFCLDGQKLIEVSITKSGAAAEYRTELDSKTRITAWGDAINPTLFMVEREDGSVSRYGEGDHSIITTRQGKLSWMLSRISDNMAELTGDSAPNHIVFHYTNFASGEYQYEVLLDYVTYSGNLVDFIWRSEGSGELRTDTSMAYRFDSQMHITQLLDDVQVFNHKNEQLRSYQLTYAETPAVDNEYASHPMTQLQGLKECGYTENGIEVCLPETKFKWRNLPAKSAWQIPVSTALPFTDHEVATVIPVDMNNDARPDLLSMRKNGDIYTVFQSLNNGTHPDGTSQTLFTFAYSQHEDKRAQILPVDITGDGKPEIIYLANGQNGPEWLVRRFDDGPAIGLSLTGEDTDWSLRPHDVNADGRPDLLYFKDNRGHIRLNTNGTGFAHPVSTAPLQSYLCDNNVDCSEGNYVYNITTTSLMDNMPIADFNGDGRADFAVNARDYYELAVSDNPDCLPNAQDEQELDGGQAADLNCEPNFKWVGYIGMVTLEQNSQGQYRFAWQSELVDARTELAAGDSHTDIDENFMQMGDINLDGLSDVVFFSRDNQHQLNIWYGGSAGGSAQRVEHSHVSSEQIQTLQLADINQDAYPDILYLYSHNDKHGWRVHYQLPNGTFSPASELTKTAGFENYKDIPLVADFNGDGQAGLGFVDMSARALYYSLDPFNGDIAPQRIHSITNGFELTTTIEYSRLTDASVYTKGENAATLQYGRCAMVTDADCSPVFDIINPSFVVSSVTSQSGGYRDNGSTLEKLTADESTLTVDYHYEGMRAQAGGRGMLGFARITTTDTDRGVETVTDYHQDFPFIGMPKRTRQVRGSGSAEVVMSEADNHYEYFVLRGNLNGSSQTGTPDADSTFYPHLKSSTESLYGLNDAGDASVQTGSIITSNTYSLHGSNHYNLTQTNVSHYSGTQTSSALKTVSTVNQYTGSDSIAHWRLGRITGATVTHSRRQADNTVGTDVRHSTFEYDATTGLLSKEIVAPDGGEQLTLTTLHCYDFVGNKTAMVTHSNHYSLSHCDDPVTLSQSLYQVYRKSHTTWSDDRRYVTGTHNALNQIQSIAVSDYNRFGQPEKVTDANGVMTQTWYNAFGQAYATQSSTGARQLTERRFSQQAHEIDVPAIIPDYYYVQKVSVTDTAGTQGAPTQFTFFDNLGRAIAKATQGFNGTDYYVTQARHDIYGRELATSLPVSKTSVADGNLRFTQNRFDWSGRLQSTTSAAGATTTITYSNGGLTTESQVTFKGNYGSDDTRNSLETRNILGETVQVQDKSDANVLNTLTYQYYPTGALHKASVAGTTVVTEFDDYGRKTAMQDPNKGHWSYTYNALGELVTQTKMAANSGQNSSAQNIVTTNTRDELGRITQRRIQGSSTETTLYQFDSAKPWRLLTECFAWGSACDNNKPVKTFSYDSLGRPHRATTTIGNDTVTAGSTFDGFGRVFQQFDDFAQRYGLRLHYNAQGYEYKQEEARYSAGSQGQVYQEVLTMNAFGKVTQYRQNGNISSTTNRYDALTGLLKWSETRSNNKVVQQNNYQFDALGNLRKRIRHSLLGGETDVNINGVVRDVKTQSFRYDALNRLTDIRHGEGDYQTWMTYQANGNISWKKDVGHYCYHASRKNAVTGTHTDGNSCGSAWQYDDWGNMLSDDSRTIVYSDFDKPTSITSTGTHTETTQFAYDTGRSRYERISHALNDDGVMEETRTLYFGAQERVYERDDNHQWTLKETRRSLPGATQTLHAQNGATDTFYQHKDHIGSANTVTNDNGQIVQKFYYDAWGKQVLLPKHTWTWLAQASAAPTLANVLDITPRGFTGHEHVNHADIIHMNGRIYDPTIGRFLQADPFIQAPDNSQSYNRYSYILNMPLNGSDPSGYLFSLLKPFKNFAKEILKSFASVPIINAAVQAAACSAGPWGCALYAAASTYAVTGNLGAAFTSGIVAGLSPGGGSWGKIATTAIIGGLASKVQGGKFGHGFWSAGIGAGVGGNIKLGNPFVNVVAAAVVGGTVSKLTGGKFANGAQTWAFSAAIAQEWSNSANDSSSTQSSQSPDANGSICLSSGGSCSISVNIESADQSHLSYLRTLIGNNDVNQTQLVRAIWDLSVKLDSPTGVTITTLDLVQRAFLNSQRKLVKDNLSFIGTYSSYCSIPACQGLSWGTATMSSVLYGEHGALWGNYFAELGGNLIESRLKLRGDADSIIEEFFKNGIQGEISNRAGDAINE